MDLISLDLHAGKRRERAGKRADLPPHLRPSLISLEDGGGVQEPESLRMLTFSPRLHSIRVGQFPAQHLETAADPEEDRAGAILTRNGSACAAYA